MTIRTKLVLAFLVFASVPMITMGFINFANAKSSLREARIAGLESTADLKAANIDKFLLGLERELRFSQNYFNVRTNLPILTRLIGSEGDPASLAAHEMLDGQLTTFRVVNQYLDLVLFSPQGQLVYDNNKEHEHAAISLPKSPADKAFREGSSDVYLGDVFEVESASGQFAMWAAAPVRNFDGGFVGVVGFKADMGPVFNLIEDTTGLGETGETLIARLSEGPAGKEVALFLNPLRHDPNAALSRFAVLGNAEAVPIQEALLGRSGSGESVDYRGENVVAVWRPIPSTGWGMVAKIDSSEAFAPISRLRDLSIIVGGSVLLLSALVSAVLAKTVVRPLKVLEEGTRLIGVGNLAHRVGTQAKDEIGELSRAFDQMTSDLQRTTASRDELDQEVRFRTQTEEESRALLDANPDMILRLSRAGEYLTVKLSNSFKIFGGSENLVGRNLKDHLPEDLNRRMLDAICRTLDTGLEETMEYQVDLEKDIRYREARFSRIGDDEVLLIVRDVTERVQIEQEIRTLNNSLENRVADRTMELQDALFELESFSYSVSHDLRGPLRSINGFSQAVMQKYGDKLDDEGRSYLERVRNATNQMGELIDDILGLSRIGRTELILEPLDLGKMVKEKEVELKSADPDRRVEFVIPDDATAFGDERLIGVLVDNLVRNAWKFSSKHNSARIELGKQEENGETVYFVKDDGAGFSMEYADKLFLPFQRLHPTGEFEGTGIGLATVRRIVQRHSGRVWAEGEVEKGATIYFTLGEDLNKENG